MKKFIFAFIAMIMLTGGLVLFSFTTTENHKESNVNLKTVVKDEEKNTSDVAKIGIYIDFGKPSRNCTGFGICKLQVSIGGVDVTIERPDNESYADASKLNSNLELIIPKNSMNSKIQNDLFSSEYFLMEEEYSLSMEDAKSLGFDSGFTIRKGKYKITELSDSYKIIF